MHLSTAETWEYVNSRQKKEKEIKQPVISVVMPVYNTAAYLKGAISSVLKQTFSSFELILVNDASKDESRKICERACKKDKRVRLIDYLEHRGVSHARNLGIEAAKGKYICFQDSDDLMHPQLLECMWQEAEKIQADLVMTDHWNSNIYSEKTWQRSCARPAVPEWKVRIGEQVWDSWFSSRLDGIVWAKLFSAKAIGNLRFNEESDRSEDWLFNYRFISEKPRRIAMTGFKGYYHVDKPNGLCHQASYDEFLLSMKIKRFVREQELKAGRERNALIAEQKMVACVRDWLFMNPAEAAEHRDQLLRLLREQKGQSPLYEKLSVYQKFLLFLSIHAMPVYRGLKAGRDHTLRFKNSLFSKT